MNKRIKILTSVMGLGTYIPAVHTANYLRENHCCADVDLFEAFLEESAMEKYIKTKKLYQNSYEAAVLGHRLASKKLKTVYDKQMIDRIIKKWEEEDIDTFLIFSGNWTFCVNRYMNQKKGVRAIIVHMDIGTAPSWERFDNPEGKFVEIHPIDQKGVHYIIDNHYDQIANTASADRQDKLFLHGGGWGMGTYLKKVNDLSKMFPNPIITVINDEKEYQFHKNIDYYRMDSDWKPWAEKHSSTVPYPPMYKIDGTMSKEGGTCKELHSNKIENNDSNGLYGLYRSCCAIISKPGGGTLMDSLITEVPIVFLEPVAKHEKVNEEVWIKLGLGMSYKSWIQSGDPMKECSRMKEKIKKIKSGVPYLGSRLRKEIGIE